MGNVDDVHWGLVVQVASKIRYNSIDRSAERSQFLSLPRKEFAYEAEAKQHNSRNYENQYER